MNFLELTDATRDTYYSFTNRFASYSDLNFTSLTCWSENVKFSIEDDILVVLFDDYSNDAQILTGLCEQSQATTLVEKLLHEQSKLKKTYIDAIPDFLIEGLGPEYSDLFEIAADQSDYLYLPSSQINLAGSQFSGYRRKLSILERSIGQPTVDFQNTLTPEDADLCVETWTTWKEVSNPKELEAMKRYVRSFDKLINQHVVKIVIKGVIEGFALCEIIEGSQRDYLIHFFKTNKAYEGLANFAFQTLAKHAESLGANYMNFEQDLGEPGLRYYKQHLRPDKLLEKYRLKVS